MHGLDILYMVLFLLIIGNMIVDKYLLISIKKLVHDDIFNNTRNKLYEIIYKETDTLSSKTICEKTLVRYFNTKLTNVFAAYEEIKKDMNVGLIFNTQFESKVLGDGSSELHNMYSYFPQEFTSKINDINKICYKEFIDNFKVSMMSSNKKNDKLHALKSHTINSFRKNIKIIYKLYLDTRHLVNDPEFMEEYPELFKNNQAILEETHKTEYMTLYNVVKLEKGKVKELVALGNNGLVEALHILNIFTGSNSELNNEVILTQSRLSTYNKNIRLGVSNPSEEINKITNSTLEILNKL